MAIVSVILDILAEFQKTGRALAAAGLTTAASGNLSLRGGGRLFITAHDSRLDGLAAADVVETGLAADDENTPRASSELGVHRAIYRATEATAIVHAHPAHAVALSVADTRAADMAGAPVIGHSLEIVAGALAEEIAAALRDCHLVMVRGHGSFATGRGLDAALRLTLAFEEECRKLCNARGIAPKRVEG